MRLKQSLKFIIQESRVKNLIKKYLDEFGLIKTATMTGLPIEKIAQIANITIDSEIAYQVLIERIKNGELPNTYKEFVITVEHYAGVVYWEANLRTGHYPVNMIEQVTIMATPFWDGGKFTPVELDWFTLLNEDMNIVYEMEGGGNFFKELKHQTTFKNIDLKDWYNEFYLPSVYDIIMNTLIPKAQRVVDFEINPR